MLRIEVQLPISAKVGIAFLSASLVADFGDDGRARRDGGGWVKPSLTRKKPGRGGLPDFEIAARLARPVKDTRLAASDYRSAKTADGRMATEAAR